MKCRRGVRHIGGRAYRLYSDGGDKFTAQEQAYWLRRNGNMVRTIALADGMAVYVARAGKRKGNR